MNDSSTGANAAPTISVLVPIYNVQAYLRESLDSLHAQSFTDFEVLCLDDGSTDDSSAIADEYAAADPRFRVVHKPNSGYGATMNRGLDEARGAWIALVEPDDVLEPDALEALHALATAPDAGSSTPVDLAKADFWFYWSNPKRNKLAGIIDEKWTQRTFDPVDEPDAFFAMPSIWSGIYRADFLRENDIRFLETPGASFQDLGFTFKVLASARRARFTQRPVLHYRQDNESSSINDPKKAFCVFPELSEIDARVAALPDGHRKRRLERIVYRMKYDNYVWNLGRLPKNARADFLHAAVDDLLAGRQSKMHDPQLFHAYQNANLSFMLDDTERFLDRFPEHPTRLQKIVYYTSVGGPLAALDAAGLPVRSKKR